MTEYTIPYGTSFQTFQLPEDWEVSVLKPQARRGLEAPIEEIQKSLQRLGRDFDSRGGRKTVAVAINDKTRPVPHSLLLPPLLEWLEQIGYHRNDITLIIASGAHTPMLPEEFHNIVPGDIQEQYRIISHDAYDTDALVYLGTTTAGSRCLTNRNFMKADLKVVVGNIEPHQFMGWSGGIKSAAIGLGGAESITANHAMLSRDGAGPCRFDDNPVRQDVEEMGRLISVDLALNVVMNGTKEIVEVFAGNPQSVMKRGIEAARSLFTSVFEHEADLVITSAGGHPKDINLYQVQKALRHASSAAKSGAPMILVGACPEGIGSAAYQAWTSEKKSHKEVRESFEREEFKLGVHKAMLIAGDAEDRDVYLVSEIPAQAVKGLLLEPAETVQIAVDRIRRQWDSKGRKESIRVAVLPYGNSTVPVPIHPED
jgi:nickel-dependent lactate racemase